MTNARIEMLEYRMERSEQQMEDWNKLARGIEATIAQILKDQAVMQADVSTLKQDVSTLKQDVNQLALGQIQLMETTNQIKDQQSQMMAILLNIIDRLPS